MRAARITKDAAISAMPMLLRVWSPVECPAWYLERKFLLLLDSCESATVSSVQDVISQIFVCPDGISGLLLHALIVKIAVIIANSSLFIVSFLFVFPQLTPGHANKKHT